MAAMSNIMPNDFSEEAALYTVMLYAASLVEATNTGNRAKATMIIKRLTVRDENKKAFQ